LKQANFLTGRRRLSKRFPSLDQRGEAVYPLYLKLTEQAKREGVSINSLVTSMIAEAMDNGTA